MSQYKFVKWVDSGHVGLSYNIVNDGHVTDISLTEPLGKSL
jgi:hypothetical protein